MKGDGSEAPTGITKTVPYWAVRSRLLTHAYSYFSSIENTKYSNYNSIHSREARPYVFA